MRLFILMTLTIPVIFAQHLSVEMAREPAAMPVLKAEQKRRISTSPEAVFNALLSASPEAKRRALRELGKRADDFCADSEIEDVRLAMVNLDDDPELEAVLTYTTGRKLVPVQLEMEKAFPHQDNGANASLSA
jgi:hypothetical protein